MKTEPLILEYLILEARRLVKKQDDAIKNNKDTIEEEAIEFIRKLAMKEIN